MRILKVLTIALMAAFTTLAASAQTVTVPNMFVSGQPALAADVNANFQALVTAVNALQLRVAKLEGTVTTADLVGTYTFYGYQSEVDACPTNCNLTNVQHSVYTGTCTLQSSTYTCSTTENGFNNKGSTGFISYTNTGNISGTWSLSGNTVTLTPSSGSDGPPPLTLASGGSILLGVQSAPNAQATAGGADATLVILVRNQP